MRKLALFLGVAVSGWLFLSSPKREAVAAVPPVDELVLAGAKCGNDVCEGSATTKTRILGGLSLEGNAAHNDGGNTITFSGRATLVQDFPALPTNGNMLVGGHICSESAWAATATGVRFGDTCMLGIDQAYVNSGGFCQGYVSAADAVKVRCCGQITDGGSFNMPDASYTVRCFR